MKVTEKKFLNVHQTLSPLLPNGIAAAAAVSAKDLEAAKAAAVATAADKVMVSGERASLQISALHNLGTSFRLIMALARKQGAVAAVVFTADFIYLP